MKRNRVPFIDFETNFPKRRLPTPTVVGAFTLSKQKKIAKLLEDTPQTLFRGVIRQLYAESTKHVDYAFSNTSTIVRFLI